MSADEKDTLASGSCTGHMFGVIFTIVLMYQTDEKHDTHFAGACLSTYVESAPSTTILSRRTARRNGLSRVGNSIAQAPLLFFI